MRTVVLLFAFLAVAAPVPIREAPEARWRRLSPHRQQRLQRVYRRLKTQLPEEDWARYKQLRRAQERPGLERLPSHWRHFLVRHARWARAELKKLPPQERARIDRLPPDEKAAAIKNLLRPRFEAYLRQCRETAEQVFTPLELKLIRELPPRERATVLKRSRHNAFELISPWSWQKYQKLGPKRRLVWEYLSQPVTLRASAAPPKPRQGPHDRPDASPR
jgi:hypothetical protein